jgi:hypothetical protein
MTGQTRIKSLASLAEAVLVALAVGGLLFVAAYIHAVYEFNQQVLPIYYFWGFAVLFSVAIGLLWIYRGGTKGFLYLTLGSGFVINALFFFRFYYYSSDLTGEYMVAQQTINLGRWPLQLDTAYDPYFNLQRVLLSPPVELVHRYYSTISVTIFPSTLSEVTGLPLIDIFRILMPLTTVLSALFVFLIVRLCFGFKVASLSTLIYVFLALTAPLRQAVAYFFFLFALFYILKGGGWKSLLLALVGIALIAPSHYATFYFSIVALVLVYLARKAIDLGIAKRIAGAKLQLKPEISLSLAMVVFAVVMGVAWLYFVGFSVFTANFVSLITSILGIFNRNIITVSPFQNHIVSSSLGPFNTATEWLERSLALLGLVVLIRKFRTPIEFSFVVLATGMLLIVGVFAVAPGLANAEDLNRVLGFADLGFTALIASSIFLLGKSFPQSQSLRLRILTRWTSQSNLVWKYASISIVVILLVLMFVAVLNFPILYSSQTELGTQQYASASQNSTAFYSQSDFQFASWLQVYTNQSATFASNYAGLNVLTLGDRISYLPVMGNSSQAIDLLQAGKTNYLVVISYLPTVLTFDSGNTTAPVINGISLNQSQISDISNNSHINRIYDNSRDILMDYTHEHTTF